VSVYKHTYALSRKIFLGCAIFTCLIATSNFSIVVGSLTTAFGFDPPAPPLRRREKMNKKLFKWLAINHSFDSYPFLIILFCLQLFSRIFLLYLSVADLESSVYRWHPTRVVSSVKEHLVVTWALVFHAKHLPYFCLTWFFVFPSQIHLATHVSSCHLSVSLAIPLPFV